MDVRWPIGILFSIFGMILALAGAFRGSTQGWSSADSHINLQWGVVLLLFGGAMQFLARRHARASGEADRLKKK